VFSIPVTDTTEQTRAVLTALAAEVAASVAYEPWHALQEWLELGERNVTVPFAETLATLVPPVAVRLRRDFGAILNLIKAHALLHRASRPRDDRGRIVATLHDYAVVRRLVADLVSDGVGITVSNTIRETVEVVRRLHAANVPEVSVSQVARTLGVDTSTAWRRVTGAISREFLRNLETRTRRPARLVIGEPLPEKGDVLPPASSLRAACGFAGVRPGEDPSPSPPNANGSATGATDGIEEGFLE
jgi:hypothetical protein